MKNVNILWLGYQSAKAKADRAREAAFMLPEWEKEAYGRYEAAANEAADAWAEWWAAEKSINQLRG